MNAALRDLVAAELSEPVDPRVAAMAAAIAAKHGAASRAVLFYGSCLREKQLDGLMPDYAVLSEADFRRLNGPETRNSSVWARFAQPSRLAWAKDGAAKNAAIDAVARATPTLLTAAGRVAGETILGWWRRAFALTYSVELRAERTGRAASVIDADPARYEAFGKAAELLVPADAIERGWGRRRAEGKALSVIRLAKASATYAGGAEYIIWKINRHAGTQIELTEFQKRHPLLAAVSLLPRLLKSGAIR